MNKYFSYFFKDTSRKKVYCFLTFILLITAFILRIKFGWGICQEDSFAYEYNSFYFLEQGAIKYLKNCTIGNAYSERFSFTVPIALTMKIFGVTENAAIAFPLFCSLASIIIIFFIGKVLFNEIVGFISAFIFTFIPIEVFYSSQIMPDTFIPFYTASAILFFSIGIKTENRTSAYINNIAAGFFLFLAFKARDTNLYIIFAFFIAAFIIDRKKLISLFIPLAAFISLELLYSIFASISSKKLIISSLAYILQYMKGTNPHSSAGELIHFRAADFSFSKLFQYTITGVPFINFIFNISNVIKNISVIKPIDVFNYFFDRNFGLLYYLFWPSLLYLILKIKKKKAVIPISVFAVLFFFWEFVFYFYNFFGFIYLEKIHRHMTVFSAPVSLIIGSSLYFFAFNEKNFSFKEKQKKKIIFILLFYAVFSILMIAAPRRYEDKAHTVSYRNIFNIIKSEKGIARLYIPNAQYMFSGNIFFRYKPQKNIEYIVYSTLKTNFTDDSLLLFEYNDKNSSAGKNIIDEFLRQKGEQVKLLHIEKIPSQWKDDPAKGGTAYIIKINRK